MPRLAALLVPVLLVPALLAACAAPVDFAARSPRGAERDPRADACRAEATRIVQFRERGQTMRTDETENSRGIVTVAPYSRAESDRGSAQIERDRIVADCLRGNPAGR